MNIPKHLRRILHNVAMAEGWIFGECICPCSGTDFRVSVFAERNGQGYPMIAAYENGFTLKILAECADCGEKHLLFDYAKHGFSGVVLGDGVPVPDTLTEAWLCPDCGGDIFSIRTVVQPGDYGQYLQETDTAEPMTEEAFSEVFDWIRIDLQCRHCSRIHEEWISLETS